MEPSATIEDMATGPSTHHQPMHPPTSNVAADPKPARRMSRRTSEFAGLTGPNLAQHRMSIRRESKLTDLYAALGQKRHSIIPFPGSYRASRSSIANTNISGLLKISNTYQLGPQEDERFNAERVEKLMSNILHSYLDGETYDAKTAPNTARTLTEVIKNRVKELNFPRYKFVCLVQVGEKSSQSMVMASRCIWNTEVDNYSTSSFENGSLYAVATVFATYFE